MCRLLGVSRNAYYRYCLYQQGRLPDPEHEGMLAAVKEVAESSGYSYGSRRMKAKSVTDALRMALWRRRPAAGLIGELFETIK
ncbi:MAG: hypothetical protein U5K38_01925 [Woeseiaceae bacterium]|nr:hypothetical protein [Woeseiaceae bacterium]